MIYLTDSIDFKQQVMGSRFARCLGMAPKVLLNDKYQEIYEEELILEQPGAVALSLDKSENKNPTIVGLDWNEV